MISKHRGNRYKELFRNGEKNTRHFEMTSLDFNDYIKGR